MRTPEEDFMKTKLHYAHHLKLAVLDGYGLGLEAARKINKGEV